MSWGPEKASEIRGKQVARMEALVAHQKLSQQELHRFEKQIQQREARRQGFERDAARIGKQIRELQRELVRQCGETNHVCLVCRQTTA